MNSHECAAIKRCSKCSVEKPLEAFNKKSVWCKPCVSAYDKEIYRRKRETILAQKVAYRAANKEKVAQANKEWRESNLERVAEYQRNYRQENAGELAAKKRAYYEANQAQILEGKRLYHMQAKEQIMAKKKEYYARPDKQALFAVTREKRRARMGQAMPMWADKHQMAHVYAEAKRISRESGVLHHVDHIVPLFGKNVCGLHAHTNLQILPAVENCRKSNRLLEDIV